MRRIQRNCKKRNRNFAEQVRLYLNTRAGLHSRMLEREQIPGSLAFEAKQIAEHVCRTCSTRVGRAAAVKVFDPAEIRLAVVAPVRSSGGRSRYSFEARGAAGKMERGTALRRSRAARDSQ